jgi:hypothetical protein
VYYGQRNVEYLYFKDMPGWLFWRHLPAHSLNAVLAFLYFSSKGQIWSYIKSKIDFLRNIRPVLRKRRKVQARRRISCQDINRLLDRKWLRARLPGK